MRLSPSRVTSAVLPSGANATPLGPESALPMVTFPAGATVLPSIVNTETVPSARLATNAKVPALLMAIPAGPLPACSVASTVGAPGDPFTPTAVFRRPTRPGFNGERSITVTLSSGICLVASAGSIIMLEDTRAMSSLGEIATLVGGPTTLLGTLISASTLGGVARRSMTVTVSGAGLFCTSALPSTSLSLASLAEIASCA